MATPYVPVPIPIGSSSSSFTNRNQRSPSFGSISTSSSSSKGQLEDSTISSFKKMSIPDQTDSASSLCSSPLVRTKFTGVDTSIEYCSQPVEEVENTDSRSWEDRPSTPTILGYEVMEERAKFTVSFGNGVAHPVMITIECILHSLLVTDPAVQGYWSTLQMPIYLQSTAVGQDNIPVTHMYLLCRREGSGEIF